jgi:3-carboxy-cis,cis-muconate cycloisomerase
MTATATSNPPTARCRADTGLLSPGWAGTDAVADLSDEAWVRAMLDVEVALAAAQAELGIVPVSAAETVAEAARAGSLDLTDLVAGVRATANPVVRLVALFTEAVAALDPAAAEYVHRGSTSQDILDTAEMLLATRVLSVVRQDLGRTATALAELVERHRDTPMVARTLTQHAVPTTFGAKAAGWLHLVLDAADRLDRLSADGLPVSLGGAAGTLAAYGEYAEMAGGPGGVRALDLVELFAAHLGLRAPAAPWHAVRTPMADLASVLTFTATALGKFAADVLVLSRTEIAELAEPAENGRGASSAMPQKRNPVLATLIATAARQVPPGALVLWQSVVAEDERSAGAWHAEWQPLRECLRLVLGAAANAAELAAGLEVRTTAMAENLRLTGGAVVSERLGAALAPVLGKSTAKQLLGEVTRQARRDGTALADVLADELSTVDNGPDRDRVEDLLQPHHYTGCAAELADRALARYRASTR